MKFKYSLFLIISLSFCALALSLRAEVEVTPPPRPENVSDYAIWAGGFDGGAWIEQRGNANGRFSYWIYNDNGRIWAIGEFIYCHLSKTEPRYSSVNIDSIPETFDYSGFDGSTIMFSNYDYILVPDGWILFPLMDSTYKKQLYEVGVAENNEIQFDSIPISDLN